VSATRSVSVSKARNVESDNECPSNFSSRDVIRPGIVARYRRRGRFVCRCTGSISDPSLSGVQLLVSDSMGCVGIIALTPLQILYVFSVVAFEPNDLAVAFEREDVGCYSI
jgi:hypothetical protein